MSLTIEEQKSQKKAGLMRAAYECFLEKGIHKTAVDEIVRKANVAKGTFYLYFRDKADLMQHIYIQKSQQIILSAYTQIKQHKEWNLNQKILGLLDYVVEYFSQNHEELQLFERNFSWPLMESALNSSENSEFREMMDTFENDLSNTSINKDKLYLYLFSIVALCGSVCYSSIIMEQPANIEQMKPVLYDIVSKILR